MTKILVLYAHPAQQFSRVNRFLAETAQNNPVIFFNDLYSNYPNFLIDIEREQSLLLRHDVVLFQHPLYWYSTPAILKEWQDIVLQPGFAYGEGGTHLKGKYFSNVITTGGAKTEYCSKGHNEHPIIDFLLPIHQTMLTCGMQVIDPFITYGMHYNSDVKTQRSELNRFTEWLEQLSALTRI